jgi:hypothetical protein
LNRLVRGWWRGFRVLRVRTQKRRLGLWLVRGWWRGFRVLRVRTQKRRLGLWLVRGC